MPKTLTAAQAKALDRDGNHKVDRNLYLQIRGGNRSRSWLFRYSRGGKPHWLGLGSAADITLTDAQRAATKARALLYLGIDPIENKRATDRAGALATLGVTDAPRGVSLHGVDLAALVNGGQGEAPNGDVLTFAEAAEQYIDTHKAGWKNQKHVAQWESTLKTYAGPFIGKTPVNRITVHNVLAVLQQPVGKPEQPLWTTRPETAGRLRGRIEKVLGWAMAQWPDAFPSGDNPARWKGPLMHLLSPLSKVQKIEHHKAVPYADVPDVMTQLADLSSVGASALKLVILTAVRTGEALGARWSEIDLDAKVWTIPAARMKAGVEHKVPLSDAAVELLESLPRNGDYLFPGQRGSTKPISNMTMLKVLRGIRDDGSTVHGFRSSFSTWAREQTDYARELAEAALAHTVGSAVERAYARTSFFDKRRDLMTDWSAYITGAKGGEGDTADS